MSGFKNEIEKLAKMRPETSLKEHQKWSLAKLNKSDALLLYHGLGSGKTLTSIAATEGLKTNVVVPASLRTNYQKEIKKFTSGKNKRNIMSYEAATKELPAADALVLDEAHRLGDIATQRTKAIISGVDKHKKRILLTGTPIRNYPHELAPLLHILNPESKITTDPAEFKKRFIEDVRVSPGMFNIIFRRMRYGYEQRPKNLAEFKKYIKGKVDYYKPPTDDYPTVTEQTKTVDMTKEQKNIYKYVTGRANPYIALKVKLNMPLSKTESKQLNAFMTAARIVSNTPRPYGGKGESPKINQVIEDFKSRLKVNPNHKGIIYSNYLEGGINEIAKKMDEAGIPYATFVGGITDKKRQEIVNDYNSGKIKAILLSGAGSEGIDLQGTRTIQLLEPHWNKGRLDQVIGRGVRYKSHSHLPTKERRVDVINYHSSLPYKGIRKFLGLKKHTSSDQYLYNLASKKDKLNQQFLKILEEEGMNKEASIREIVNRGKKIVAGGVLGASLIGAPQLAKAEVLTAKQLAGNKTVSSAVWQQYKANRAARQAASRVDMNKYNPYGFAGRTRASSGKTQLPAQKSVQPSFTQSAPNSVYDKNLVDNIAEKQKMIEQKIGLKIGGGKITKDMGRGSLSYGGGKFSGQYDLGGINIKGSQKGVDEISKNFGNLRTYVQPNKKQIGVGYGFSF